MKETIIFALGCVSIVAIGFGIIFLRAEVRHLKAEQQDDAELIASYRQTIEDMHSIVAEGVSNIVEIADKKLAEQ